MKKRKVWLLAVLSSIALAVSACGGAEKEAPSELAVAAMEDPVTDAPQAKLTKEPETPAEENPSETPPRLSEAEFSASEVEACTDQAYVVVHDNKPYFSENELTARSYEYYSDLDELGRCRTAHACIGIDLMPTEDRESISQIKPTGWINAEYDHVDGKYLYNRCHLIGFQLSGENANEKNLITGTRYLNTEGMLPYENMVADYVKETGHHVMYRVTPVFEGENLVASGVLMEAQSVEDQGEGIEFCVYVYNVQPGVVINYATGESSLQEGGAEAQAETQEPVPEATDYILNTNTKKFHYPGCSSVGQMKESNKLPYTGTRDEVIAQGYDPCKRCNP